MLYPTRCQHLKVNGTQCGSPSLRRKTLCYFHHRNHEERMHLQIDRRRRITVTMPPLEDANAIQISLTQVTRMLLSGAIDQRTAGLLLYSLQIASSNLARTNFEPSLKNSVVIHPNQVAKSGLESHLWEDEDFNGIDDQEKENQQFPEIPEAEKIFVNQDDNDPEAKREGQSQAETGPPPKIPPHSVSLNSLRDMVFEHIVNAIPGIMEGLEKQGAEMFKE
jgi:hypothetical protein